VRRALEGAKLMLGLAQHQHATGREHHIVIQFLAQPFVKRARQFINGNRRILQVIGADNGGIAPRIAAAQPALFQNGDIRHFMVLGEVIGGGQAMPAGPHDHRVILRLRLWRTPGPLPILVVIHGVAGERKDRIAGFHRAYP